MVELEGLAREYIAAVDALDHTCSVDADCVLVAPELSCVGMCKRALKTSSVAQFTELQTSFSARCPGTCTGTIDCIKPPEAARCLAGLCTGE